MSLGNYSESTASILGGLVAAFSMKINFLIEGTLLLAAVILAGIICFYVIRDLLHREVSSNNRVMVLSLQSLMMRLFLPWADRHLPFFPGRKGILLFMVPLDCSI